MKFTYTNHRGQTELRDVTPLALVYFNNEQLQSLSHLASYNPGVFLECITNDRGGDIRHFAFDHIDWGDAGFRLPLDVRVGDEMKMLTDDHFKAGWNAGRSGEPFYFEATSNWVRGYNEGRREILYSRT